MPPGSCQPSSFLTQSFINYSTEQDGEDNSVSKVRSNMKKYLQLERRIGLDDYHTLFQINYLSKCGVDIKGVSKDVVILGLLLFRLLKLLKKCLFQQPSVCKIQKLQKCSEKATFEMVSFEVSNNLMHTSAFTFSRLPTHPKNRFCTVFNSLACA